MTIKQFYIFILGMILPSLYQRIKFTLNKSSFYEINLRRKTGLNIHHGHWGLIFAFMSMFLLVFGIHNVISITLAGFGWGLMLDEIVPMLKMPTISRSLELDVYAKSANQTIFLISGVTVIFIIAFTLSKTFCWYQIR